LPVRDADITAVELRTCPYDGAPIVLERMGTDATLIRCDECGARWEWHNAYLRRVAEPDQHAVRRGRAQRRMDEQSTPDDEPPRMRAHVRR
jgi:hypothetical protein